MNTLKKEILKKTQLWGVMQRQFDLSFNQKIASIQPGFVPSTLFSLNPGGIHLICTELTLHERKVYLEIGAGISTFYAAKLKKDLDLNCKIISCDNDADWLNFMDKHLQRLKLREMVVLVHAELNDSNYALKGNKWYDSNALSTALEEYRELVDLVLVDGPFAALPPFQYSRFAAGPFLKDYLSDDACVILDDVGRCGEAHCVKKWPDILNAKYEDYELTRGVGAFRRGTGFTTS